MAISRLQILFPSAAAFRRRTRRSGVPTTYFIKVLAAGYKLLLLRGRRFADFELIVAGKSTTLKSEFHFASARPF